MEYTKGEWKVAYCGQGLTNIVVGDDNDDVIAIVDNSRDNHSSYDADLIAAAPEMYEALSNMVSWYMARGFDRELPQFRASQKALAKVEGKS